MFAEVHLLDELHLLMQYIKVICISSSKRPAIVGHPSAPHKKHYVMEGFYSFLQRYYNGFPFPPLPSFPLSFLFSFPLPFPFSSLSLSSLPCPALPFLTSLWPVVATFLPPTAAFSPFSPFRLGCTGALRTWWSSPSSLGSPLHCSPAPSSKTILPWSIHQ